MKEKRKFIKKLMIISAYIIVVAIGSSAAVIISELEEMPDVKSLERYKPILPAQVYDADNKLIHEFAVEKRVLVKFQDIPKIVQDAIIAAEDAHFWQHTGIYPIAIIRAFISNLRAGRIVQGGSTITQQLAKLLFLTPERTFKRKMKEALLAIQIEHNYSKEEILTLYCNQIYFGHGIYGIEAAANFFFGKHLNQLKLEEAALLAGIPKAAGEYSPLLNYKNALERRNYVLRRMYEENFITEKEAKEAMAEPIKLANKSEDVEFAAFFIEEVRKYIERKYGYEGLYTAGLKVYTTLDSKMQMLAEEALRKGLHNLAKKQKFNKNLMHISFSKSSELEYVSFKEWQNMKEGKILPGVIIEVSSEEAIAKIDQYKCYMNFKSWEWTNIKKATELFKVGDVPLLRIDSIDNEKNLITCELEQEPPFEGAIFVMEIGTGRIKAMVGGYSFRRSKFNRTTQALRQPGSAFKPIIFAAAFEKGFTPADIIEDAPITFVNPYTHQVWSPGNYTGDFLGFITLRRALELSRNTTSVRLLNKIGVKSLIDMAKRLGIQSPIQPYLSSALGASDVTLYELVSAYSVFANQGIYVEPYFITKIIDADGNVLEEHHPFLREALSAEVAYLVTDVLKGVIERGTAVKAKSLNRILAGKTGTTDDFTDAWFIGYSPSLIAGVWVGYDEKKSLGKNQIGGRVALPIWIDFMKEALKDKPNEDFSVPANIEFIPIDRITGLRASVGCPSVILEAFIKGTAPISHCSAGNHTEIQPRGLD